ncbi:FG-GAP repeat domain-containing protein, partial [Paraglaciecola hydrolytica]|uniref:FG-GAP repeat domain-containing protein n=1 Tax=Paraglaciecola hydrolytica TaxID=1799789 RepID=UPI001F1E3A4E
MKNKNSPSLMSILTRPCLVLLCGFTLLGCKQAEVILAPTTVDPAQALSLRYDVSGSLTKKLILQLDNPASYASVSIYADDELLLDNLNVPKQGKQEVTALVRFARVGEVKLKLKTNAANVTFNSFKVEDVKDLTIPEFKDISHAAGLDKVSSIKYGGPTIADMDNDGDYDFIVNNHNQADSKLYWNNGDGTVRAHDKNLSRWFMHDLHGTAAGDYDNDGDLDLVVTQGGGNGTNPSKTNFYKNDNGTLVLMTGDVGIDKGGRGRGARWSDFDSDGDLDLFLFNEEGLG